MFRHLPILLIIFATTGAHAEQGFFEQLLDSLKSKATAVPSEPAGDLAASTVTESEPLALQPTTTTRRYYKKRNHAGRRHPARAPSTQAEAQAESLPTAPKKSEESSPPAASPELISNSKPVESVLPSGNESNVLPSPAVWPNPTPVPLAPWPDESSSVEGAQGGASHEVQAESRPTEKIDARADVAEVADEVEPEFFLDSQRVVLAGFSATWLALGIAMFIFRRRLARTLNSLRQRRVPDYEMPPDEPPALTIILGNAARDHTVVEKAGRAETRAVAAG